MAELFSPFYFERCIKVERTLLVLTLVSFNRFRSTRARCARTSMSRDNFFMGDSLTVLIACDSLKKSYFPLIRLPICDWTVCYRAVQ